MAITRAKKEELVAQYKELIEQSDAIFITEYTGIGVKTMQQLRKNVREANGLMFVTKNTLLRRALEELDREIPLEILDGQVATGFAMEEAPTLAKALVDFAKDEERLILKGGLLGEDIMDASQVEALAKLPTLDQLRAQILGLITAPAQNIVTAVTNGVRQVVNVVDAYAKSEESAEAA